MATNTVVEGDQRKKIEKKLDEIKRQIKQRSGYPWNAQALDRALQRLINGEFDGANAPRIEVSESASAVAPAALRQALSVQDEVEQLVEHMLRHNYHCHADATGLSGADYKSRWTAPAVLEGIEELRALYAGRLPRILLVDNTLTVPQLVQLGNIMVWTALERCTDVVPVPQVDGMPLKRYVACWQDGTAHLSEDHTVEWCRANFAQDEVGLVSRELLHLPVEHEVVLRHHGVDGAGSSNGAARAPFVNWFHRAQPSFDAVVVRGRGAGCGSGSRGIRVVPVL